MKEELKDCYEKRVPFSSSDIQLATDLWNAYQADDLIKLRSLSLIHSPCFPLLKEVCEAHIERFPEKGPGRPQRKLKQLLNSGDHGLQYDLPRILENGRHLWLWRCSGKKYACRSSMAISK
jgi:hypothetical protein